MSAVQNQPKNAGPDGWRFLHLAAIDGKLTQQVARDFGACVQCPDCARHFMQTIEANPITSAADAFGKTVKWHNAVNLKRNVPTVSVETAHKLWTAPRSVMVSHKPSIPSFANKVVAAL